VKKHISNFHYISGTSEGNSHAELSEQACKGGANWVQLRAKNLNKKDWNTAAQEVQKICLKYNATFIINDNVSLAQELNADGVHLGKDDISVPEARRIIGSDKIIGGTANTIEDIKKLAKQGADYIGIGPFKFTKTKDNLSPVLGLKKIGLIVKEKTQNYKLKIPLIVIGGITTEDVSPLIDVGVDGIAVSSAVNNASSIKIACQIFIGKLNLSNKIQNYANQPSYC